jgi:septum formation protein
LTYSQRICQDKAHAAWDYMLQNKLAVYPVLTADTEVVHNGEVLGKPADYEAAFTMWKRLAGEKHLVITSLTLKYYDFEKTLTRESWVHFDDLSEAEIHAYLASGDYKDKSGSYGIQSFAGQFIKKIDGCFYSIMGLPLNAVRQLLRELNEYVK